MELHQCRTHAGDFRVFSHSLQGKVRSRHHAEYAGWHFRAPWNGRRFERYPEYIVRAATISDVVKTIDFARFHGLAISVKGTGHSYAGCFFRDGGVLLDLSLLDELELHPERNMAIVGPGVTSARLTRSLAACGLAFPTGHGGGVGLSGFLLGGGLGVNCDAWGGMSTFNVQAIDVVTADGQCLHADENQNAELLWAARGGGACLFFVVVRFYLKCWPAPEKIVSRNYRFDPEDLPSVLHAVANRAGDRRVQTMVVLAGDANLAASLSATAFCNGSDEARALHADLFSAVSPWTGSEFDEQALEGFQPIYDMTDSVMVSRRYRADNVMTNDAEAASRALLARFGERPSSATFSLLIHRPAHTYPDAAFSLTGRFFVSTYAQWNDESDDASNRDWLKALYDELSLSSTGHYINEVDLEERAGMVSRCFSNEAWRRLQALRRRYDEGDVFPGVSQ